MAPHSDRKEQAPVNTQPLKEKMSRLFELCKSWQAEAEAWRKKALKFRDRCERLEHTNFLRRLEGEKSRSERHDHSFAVVVLRPSKDAPEEVCRRLQYYLRQSDVVGVASTVRTEESMDEPAVRQVCVMLPETDRPQAQQALTRMSSLFADMRNLSVGVAVYPRDEEDASQLMEAAQRSARDGSFSEHVSSEPEDTSLTNGPDEQ